MKRLLADRGTMNGILGLALALGLGLLAASGVWAQTSDVTPNQSDQPYGFERPPSADGSMGTTVLPNDQPLTDEELKRAEALVPLLDGKQEYWAMGEFVHLGPGVVPVLVKALSMPGPRIRYNAIETVSILKASAAVPALLETAQQANEMPRIREHALRVAVRLDPLRTVPAIQAMVTDQHDSIRKVAAFEARYVRHRDVVPSLIGLLTDPERYVAISALQSLWLLTRHETEMHNWDNSSKQDRDEWTQEWQEWWESVKDSFEMPPPRSPRAKFS
ncbi:MAG: HEAT repeat domain-containing protein [Nitrospiraceae bacterium]